MPETESLRRKLERRKEDLISVRSPWHNLWTEQATYIAPSRLRLTLGKGEGQKLRGKIINSEGSYALRTLKSGMHSGITSPARPWFKLLDLDPELSDFAPVKQWLSDVETKMRQVFASSNVYTSFHTGYGDLGLFGQSAGLLIRDRKNVVRMIPLLHGSFWLARDHTGRATTLFREFQWSVERIVARFGYDACSLTIQRSYDQGKLDDKFTVNHAVYPRRDRDPYSLTKQNKPFASVYWEEGARSKAGSTNGLLEESGFDYNPIIAPPWELIGDDHYADSPGALVLPDVKSLQVLDTRSHEGIDKKVRPPMTGPMSLKNNGASLLPGSITYVDDPQGRNGYKAAIDVNLSLMELENKIGRVEQRVQRGFYADLWLMLANMEGIQPRNQFEIAERKEEKLLALGPVLENIYGGQLAPTIDIAFDSLMEMQMVAPAPEELRGRPLKVEYISILAQAQKAVATGALERGLAFVGNLSAGKPEALDRIDADEAIDSYWEAIGAPVKVLASDDKVKAIRDARAQANDNAGKVASFATAAPALEQSANAAKVLSETDTGTAGSLLQKLGITP